MKSVELAKNVFWVGALDPDLRIFDINVKTEYGTTYNAYLVKGDKTALIDGVKSGFEDQLFERLLPHLEIEDLDYFILNHTEPDHSGAVGMLLERNPNLKLLCAKPALPFLKNIINNDQVSLEGVKDGQLLELGGATLEFISAPFMHWPDTMFTYLVESKILFSCDGYGAHYAPFDDIFYQQGDEVVDHAAWYYYDCIMRPYASHCRKASLKVINREMNICAPSHGPVNQVEPKRFIKGYLEWTEIKKPSSRPLLVIAYASSYGNTGQMAETLCNELQSSELDVELVDVQNTPVARQRDLYEAADGLLFGSPTFVNDAVKPIWDSLHLLSTISCVGKKAGAFGSYGWGGQATAIIESYLRNLKLKVHESSCRVRLVPSATDLEDCRQFARGFSEFLLN